MEITLGLHWAQIKKITEFLFKIPFEIYQLFKLSHVDISESYIKNAFLFFNSQRQIVIYRLTFKGGPFILNIFIGKCMDLS